MKKIIYRKATPKDYEGICKLRHQLLDDPEERLAVEYAPYNEKIDNPWIKKCLRSKRIVILVAEDSEGICAHSIVAVEKVPQRMLVYVTYKKKARLVHLYVAVNKRHQGIGKMLLKYTLKYLKEKGAEFVDLECYMRNDKAAALYKKVGFKDVFVEKRYDLKGKK
ncbi:MAG: GNAT family N-acetyltransferase [Alphaproteobacteria bacterium]|nr:GNAT family N-acetyltransferase [Alphaproteobacteria bacterium]